MSRCRALVFGILGVLGLLLILLVLISGNASAADSGPVHYIGDAELAASPLVTGSGTEVDPYVFANHTIDCAGFGYGIILEDTMSHVKIVGCTFSNATYVNLSARGAGVSLDNCSNVSVIDCVFVSCDFGIWASQSEECLFTDNDLSSTIDIGIVIESSSSVLTARNVKNVPGETLGAGVYVGGSQYVAINDTSVVGCGKSLMLVDSSYIIINGSLLMGADQYGIEVTGCDDIIVSWTEIGEVTNACLRFVTCAHVHVHNSSFHDSIDNGIEAHDSDMVVIEDNLINNTDTDTPMNGFGIAFYSCGNCSVQRNACTNNTNFALLCFESDNCSVIDNVIHDVSNGIQLYVVQDALVQENDVHTTNGLGIYLYNCDAAYVIGNEVVGDTELTNWGIGLIDCRNGGLMDNVISGTLPYGMYVDGGTVNEISGNTVENTGSYGIYLQSAGLVDVTNNAVRGSVEHGLFATDSYSLHISGNIMEWFAYGMRLDYSYDVLIEGNSVDHSASRGIYVLYGGGELQPISIVNNSCRYSGTGILLSQVHYTVLENNDCDDCSNGISLSTSQVTYIGNCTADRCDQGLGLSDSHGSTVVGGSYGRSLTYGIYVGGSDSTHIEGVNASGNGFYGLYLSNSINGYIINSTFSGNTRGLNVYLDESHHQPFYIMGCRLENNTAYGIYSDGGWLVNVKGNHLANNLDYAMYLLGTSDDWYIHNNTFLDNRGIVGIDELAAQCYDLGSNNRWYVYEGDRNWGNGWSHLPNLDADEDGYVDHWVRIGGSGSYYRYQLPYGPKIEGPSAPNNLSYELTPYYIDLNWTAPVSLGNSTLVGYRVYLGLVPDIMSMWEVGQTSGDLECTVMNMLENGNTYYFAVAGYNEYDIEGDWSNILEVHYQPYPAANSESIAIHSDQDFADAKITYGWEGDGSFVDPYIIEDLIIDGWPTGYCLQIWNTNSHFVVRNCTFFMGVTLAYGKAVDLEVVHNGRFEECTFLGDVDRGLSLITGQIEVVDCLFDGPMSYGLFVSDSSVAVSDCTFNSSYYGMDIEASMSIVVERNLFLNCTYAIAIWNTDSAVVRDNEFHGGNAISISGSSECLVENNLGVGVYEFFYSSQSNWVTLRDNTANGTMMSRGAYSAFGAAVLFENNTFSGFDTGMRGYGTLDLVMRNNTLFDNRIGIRLEQVITGEVSGNIIRDSLEHGLAIDSGNQDVLVTLNSFTDNLGFAIYCEVELSSAIIHLNHFHGNNLNDGTFTYETAQVMDLYGILDWELDGLGNHWADWTSPDADGDGIVDEPYLWDDFPLVNAFGAPTGLDSAVGPDFVNLSWGELEYDFSEGVDGYSIYRGLVPEDLVLIGSTAHMWYNDTSVALGTTYYYRVSAYVGAEEGTLSDLVSATPCDVPGTPTDLTVEAGLRSFQLSWTAPSQDGGALILGYNIWRGASPTSLGLFDVAWTVTFTDLLVGDDDTWYYAVTAFNQAGDGAMSDVMGNTTFSVPSAPLNVTTLFGDGNVTVSWDAPLIDGGTPITGYVIEYVHALFGQFAYPGPDDRSWTITGLTNGWEYSFRVQALNLVGDGDWSPLVYDTPATAPGAPADLEASAASGTVRLSWLPPTEDGGDAPSLYNIYRKELDGDWAWIGNSTTLVYEDLTVSDGIVYYYQVSAVNKAGEGNVSEPVRAVAGLPSAPLNLTAVNSAGKVQLNWSTPADDGGSALQGYKIYRDGGSGFVYLGSVSSSSLGYLDTTATPGVGYSYQVTAVSANGEGLPSNEASMTLPMVPPEAPVIDSAVQEENGVIIVWHVPESSTVPEEFLVYRGEAPDSLVLIAIIDGDMREYLDIPGTAGLFYALRSSNEYGIGELSAAVQATPLTVPGAVRNLTLTEGQDLVILNWDAPEDDGGSSVLGYHVYRQLNGTVIMLATVNAMTYVDYNVVGGLLHEYWIVAMNANGAGPESIRVNVTPDEIVVDGLPAPAYLLATVGNGTVTLTWDPMTSFGVEGFRVFRSDGGNFTFLVAQSGSTYTDSGLTNGVTYTYRVYCFIGTSNGENASVDATPGKAPEAPTLNGQVALDRISLGWSVPENGGSAIIGYRLYRTPGTGTTVLLASLTGTGYIDTSVLTGVNYTYMVTALNAFGEGSPSNTMVLRISTQPSPSVDVPAEPYLSSATGGNTSISLLWNVPSDTGDGPIIGYNVYRGTSALAAELLVSVPAGTTTYVDGTVVYGTTYYYWVSALNQWGESEPSRMLSASLVVLAVPGEVDVDVDEGQGRITLSWDVPDEGGSSITEYRIYRRGETGDRQLIATVPAGTDTFVDGSVEAGVEYDYWVTAVNAAGEGPLADAPVSGVPLAILAGEAEIGPLPMIALALGAVGLLIAIVAVVLVLRKK